MPTSRHLPRPFLGLVFRVLYQHHAREVDAALRAAGFNDIRPPHAAVFPFVPPNGIQVGELATLAGVRKQSMAQTVQELEAAAYVERRPIPTTGAQRLFFSPQRGKPFRHSHARLPAAWRSIGRD
jgi:DNA-binding MarR family transcriptional regulator